MTNTLEQEAFDGLNESYVEEDKRLEKIVPKCHMRPMQLIQQNYTDGIFLWWECSYCGHTKDLD